MDLSDPMPRGLAYGITVVTFLYNEKGQLFGQLHLLKKKKIRMQSDQPYL